MTRRLVLGCAALVVAGAITISAHLTVVKSTPSKDQTLDASPARLQVWFSETPAVGISQITLAGPAGTIEIGKTSVEKDKSIAADLPKPLPAGIYTIGWRTAGDDGHPATGDIKFKIVPKKH